VKTTVKLPLVHGEHKGKTVIQLYMINLNIVFCPCNFILHLTYGTT